MSQKKGLYNTNRKDQILDAAVALFAKNGYYKTTTALVAAQVEVTQPYVFHFFKSKELLYIAVLERAGNRLHEAFSRIHAPADQLTEKMRQAFYHLKVSYHDEILLCMQSFTIPEPSIRENAREMFREIHNLVSKCFTLAGLPNAEYEASMFIACGMAVTVSEVLNIPEIKI